MHCLMILSTTPYAYLKTSGQTYYIVLLLYSHLHHHSGSQRHNIKDRRMNKRRMIKTQEGRRKKTSLTIFLPLTLLQGFERVV